MSKKRALIFAAIHFAILAVAFLMAFSSTMSRFDAGSASVPLMETVLDGVVTVLTAPLLLLARIPGTEGLADILQWPLIVANSLGWGFAAETLFGLFRQR